MTIAVRVPTLEVRHNNGGNMVKHTWERKASKIFGKLVVCKGIARAAGLPRLPQYVVEHLVAEHVNDTNPHNDLSRIRERVAEVLPEADVRELIKAKLIREGEILVFDKLDVTADLKSKKFVGTLTNLGERDVDIPPFMAERIPRLLTGGVWGAIKLRLVSNGKNKLKLQAYAMSAFQSEVPDLAKYTEARNAFTTQEWVDLLLSSLGYTPEVHNWRSKLLLLSRLIPALEPNSNIIELGPRQTGKTFLLRNVSPSVYTASGANVTAASLFMNVASGALGIIPTYKIIVLDEISHTRVDDISTVSMLKDYMESGQFSRGGRTYMSDASVVLVGNIDVEGSKPDNRYSNLFDPLPMDLQDVAFLDRVHAYLPGWELPKVTNGSISEGYGLVMDYLGQVLNQLRTKDFRKYAHTVGLPTWSTRRDTVAIEKTSSSLLKLIYPHQQWNRSELEEVVNLAIEFRTNVRDQLVAMAPGEFGSKEKPKIFSVI